MEIILFVVALFYCIYLNLRLREAHEEIIELGLDVGELEIKVYNKMMDIRREIKQSIKTKRVEKSRRRSPKKRSQLPKA
jgi:hypothetical protein|tara:strand:+ start:1078 stop:1314 length:237 start_codon:yes stop_codon:yes gene_type:complete